MVTNTDLFGPTEGESPQPKAKGLYQTDPKDSQRRQRLLAIKSVDDVPEHWKGFVKPEHHEGIELICTSAISSSRLSESEQASLRAAENRCFRDEAYGFIRKEQEEMKAIGEFPKSTHEKSAVASFLRGALKGVKSLGEILPFSSKPAYAESGIGERTKKLSGPKMSEEERIIKIMAIEFEDDMPENWEPLVREKDRAHIKEECADNYFEGIPEHLRSYMEKQEASCQRTFAYSAIRKEQAEMKHTSSSKNPKQNSTTIAVTLPSKEILQERLEKEGVDPYMIEKTGIVDQLAGTRLRPMGVFNAASFSYLDAIAEMDPRTQAILYGDTTLHVEKTVRAVLKDHPEAIQELMEEDRLKSKYRNINPAIKQMT